MVIQEYQDPRVGKYLRYGYWYMEHKSTIDRTIRLGIVLAVVGIWIGAMFQLFGYLGGTAANDALLRDMAVTRLPIEKLHSQNAPLAPVISEAAVLAGRDSQTADFAAFIENQNSDWNLEVDYIFSWADGQTLPDSVFVLPESKAVLLTRGATVNVLPAGASVIVTPKKWTRLKDKEVLARLADFREKIVVSAGQASRADGATDVIFTAQNNTIYDLATPRFWAVLSQAGTPVAAGLAEIDSLPSGAAANLELRWLQDLPINLVVEVYPQINVLDQSSYRLPKGGETKF